MENKYSITEIVLKLIGSINSIGESNHDREALSNLDQIDDLLGDLVMKLGKVLKMRLRLMNIVYRLLLKRSGQY